MTEVNKEAAAPKEGQTCKAAIMIVACRAIERFLLTQQELDGTVHQEHIDLAQKQLDETVGDDPVKRFHTALHQLGKINDEYERLVADTLLETVLGDVLEKVRERMGKSPAAKEAHSA